MGVNNELAQPNTEEDFEAMCCALYRRMWNDTGCVRMGGAGQEQYGVDIIGHDGKKNVGIQCKHYQKKNFSLSTVTDDIKKAEKAALNIEHLLFTTTAPSKSALVKQVQELSSKRRKEGKFTVSVDFWGEITGHIRLHPDIGRAYIPDFPGSTLLNINENLNKLYDEYEGDHEATKQFQATSIENQKKILSILGDGTALAARGDEADPRVVASLDHIRNKLREGKTREVLELLEALGDPEKLTDQFSRFRWHTNHASVALIEGNHEAAAAEYLDSFHLAPDHEKAHSNRVYALLLKNDPTTALAYCDDSLAIFPDNAILWALKVNARYLLGDIEPDRDIPEALRNTADLLFTRAYILSKEGKFSDALELMHQCMKSDGISWEAKRAYLADAILWASVDPVLAHHGQITIEQRNALNAALQHFETIEQVIPSIQSDHISFEVTNNVAVSLMLVGQKERARSLVSLSLVRHPLSEGLLRIKLNDLDDHKDVAAIHALTDGRLHELPISALATIAEISANRGDLAWHNSIMEAVQASEFEPQKLRELRALTFYARWVAGGRDDVINDILAYLQEHPEHILARVMFGNMLKEVGRNDDAAHEGMKCIAYLSSASSSLDILQVADLLFDLKQFRDAATLYERLMKTPSNDKFTYRLLICLVETDQRRKAQDIFDKLSPDVLALSIFRRVEANLARQMGDWKRMRKLLGLELEKDPGNSGIALGYVGALYRIEDAEEKLVLKKYLTSNPRFKNTSPENEFEFAKYQINLDIVYFAISRLYRLYRENPGSTQVAGYFLGQLLLSQRTPELDPPLEAGPGAVIYLRNSTETRCIAIDIDTTKGENGWPELVSHDSNIAKDLHGLKPSNKVTLALSFSSQEFEVERLENLFSFVARKAQEQIAAAAVPAGPIWSVRIIKQNGELDIESLLKSAQQRSEHVQSAFANYKQHRFPLSMLARAVGSDPVTLLLDWPFKESTFFVGIGTHEERDSSIKLLRQGGHRYVLDLLTIAELVRRNGFDAAIQLLGKPLVPQTLREHLIGITQQIEHPRPSAIMGEQDGQLQIIDTPQNYYDKRDTILKEMLRRIDEFCEVVPTVGPHNVTDVHRTLSEALDHDTMDVLYLCIERDAVLVSEDGGLRLLAQEAGVSLSIGVQPLLMEACDKGLYSKDNYANAVIGKIAGGHDFVSIRADDLITLAKRTPARVSEDVRTLLDSFKKSTMDIVSGVQVSCEFLRLSIQRLHPKVAVAYGMQILEVLQFERPQFAASIRRAIAHTVHQALENSSRKLKYHERKAFEPLLEVNEQSEYLIRLKPVALAVRRIFRQ